MTINEQASHYYLDHVLYVEYKLLTGWTGQ